MSDEKDKKPEVIPSADLPIILPPPRVVYPVVPIREGVLFPSTESVLSFGRSASINAIRAAIRTKKMVVLLTQKNANIENPRSTDLYQIGTLAYVEKTIKIDASINALVKGIRRVKVLNYQSENPHLIAAIEELPEEVAQGAETEALVAHLQKEFRRAVHMGKPVEFLNFMKLMAGVTHAELVDQIASTLSISTREKQALLEQADVTKRLNKVIEHLAHEMKVMEIEKDVMSKTQERFDKHMRDSVLRERLRTIQKELGEEDDEEEEVVDEYERKLKKLSVSDELRTKISKEIKRLQQMSVNNPEAGYIRTWLDTVFELPWEKAKQKTISLEKAQKTLNENHYGLDDVKDRILEYIAVLQLKQKNEPTPKERVSSKRGRILGASGRSLPTILCFVGPPGVGKTSIGQSIAQALGRSFTKVSLGGIRDEAEVRGHRRTYVGAMTGKIISGIRQAKAINPVFMLDEIDKIGSDYRGDPSAALLEALDPEQNFGFVDHYLDMPFDLSQVIFITTANTLDTIPPALLDRLEIIRYAGYTDEEKFHIAKTHLLPKVIKQNGLKRTMIKIPDRTIYLLIDRYTREAGVRSLERTLHSLARKVARELGTSKKTSISVDTKKARAYLGPEEYDLTILERENLVGLATGLAWTSVGGEVLFIEVALTEGKGVVKLTGKLGDVMKESAQTALTHVKANAKAYGINPSTMNKTDVHIHFPEGAVPKDGPSAGITITTAIVSAFIKKPIKRRVAMTGEVTLRGRVLRIGGLKEKVLAALRAGCTQVLIPAENVRDLEKIPKEIRKQLDFRPVSHVSEVLPQTIVGFSLKIE